MPRIKKHPAGSMSKSKPKHKPRNESTASTDSIARNNLIDKAKQIIDTANSKIIALNTQHSLVQAENEELEQQLIDLRQEQKDKEEIGAQYKDKLVAQAETISKWKQKIDELSQEIISIHAKRREHEQSYKENLLSITDTLDKIHGDNVGKLKYNRISEKTVIFTASINHLFYYDDSGPKFFVVKDVQTDNHLIQANMKRPWFLLIGKKRSVLFACATTTIRDKWVDFIRDSLDSHSEESNTSLIRWNANSVNSPLSPLYDVYESDENSVSTSTQNTATTATATQSTTLLHGGGHQHQRLPSYSGCSRPQNSSKHKHARTRTLSNKHMRTQSMAVKKVKGLKGGKIAKHNRTQSMTQRSRTSSFDVQPVHVTVTYNIKEDKIEQFLTALKPMVIATNKEKGCVRFNIHQDKGEKCKFIMMEEWKSQRYLTMHLKSEHLRKYRERTKNHNVHKSIPEVFFCSDLKIL